MKYIIMLGDGMADEPLAELGGKTPLECANTQTMDALAKKSEIGMAHTIPEGMSPGSDTANLAVLGYDPKIYYTGRSPLEALSIGVDMKDTDIAAPIGVAFKFSFTVDKFGNMSNIKVWSTTSEYSDMAVQRIKPVLMSYQNQPILNFPEGTKRVITNVAGGFVMSTSTDYSSPSDYSDYERVKR